jgi:6-phosphogluconate dehydrogenase (decarboxylating)
MVNRYQKVKHDLFEYSFKTQTILDRIQSYGDAKSRVSWETIDNKVIGLVKENKGWMVVDVSDGTEKIVARINEGVNWLDTNLTNNQMNYIIKNARLLKEPLGGII